LRSCGRCSIFIPKSTQVSSNHKRTLATVTDSEYILAWALDSEGRFLD
jgi:hypothetical protein